MLGILVKVGLIGSGRGAGLAGAGRASPVSPQPADQFERCLTEAQKASVNQRQGPLRFLQFGFLLGQVFGGPRFPPFFPRLVVAVSPPRATGDYGRWPQSGLGLLGRDRGRPSLLLCQPGLRFVKHLPDLPPRLVEQC